MISSEQLGVYEYIEPAKNSKKFWRCDYNASTRLYDTAWGKIGYAPQGTKTGLYEDEARDKIREKLGKGYKKGTGLERAFREKREMDGFIKDKMLQKEQSRKEEVKTLKSAPDYNPKTTVIPEAPKTVKRNNLL